MDAPTLAVVIDKCVEEKIFNQEFWSKFSWRTQQLINKIQSTELVYLMRGFSRADWFDSHLVLSMWGRADFLLPSMTLSDACVLLESYMNPRFRHQTYEEKVLNHVLSLVVVRNDWTIEELVSLMSILGRHSSLTCVGMRKKIMNNILPKIATGDLFQVSMKQFACIFESLSNLADSTHIENILALTRDLKESPRQPSAQGYGDESISIIASLKQLGMIEIEKPLISQLAIEYYDNIWRLSHGGLVNGLKCIQVLNVTLPEDHGEVLLRRINREIYKMDAIDVCKILQNLQDPASIKECLDRLASLSIEGVPVHVLVQVADSVKGVSHTLPLEIRQDLDKFFKIVNLVVTS
jgi:hypothetical protein